MGWLEQAQLIEGTAIVFTADHGERLAEKHFTKGGKLEKLYPVYEAADTFLYTPGHRTASGPSVRDGIDLKRLMIMVVIALVPATLFGMWNVGFQHLRATEDWNLAPTAAPFFECLLYGAIKFIPVYAVTIVAGGTAEAIFSIIRKHEINEGFLVTSLLFPLTLPPDIPLWQVAVGIIFGVVIGKEIFGGTGMNILPRSHGADLPLLRVPGGHLRRPRLGLGQRLG